MTHNQNFIAWQNNLFSRNDGKNKLQNLWGLFKLREEKNKIKLRTALAYQEAATNGM